MLGGTEDSASAGRGDSARRLSAPGTLSRQQLSSEGGVLGEDQAITATFAP